MDQYLCKFKKIPILTIVPKVYPFSKIQDIIIYLRFCKQDILSIISRNQQTTGH